ncbi:MAG: helix-hairpin-helix domain-containing protein [Lachnospiraceae bacterium]|jgi:competence protein ComEA|nr:helix-hairpin-helix domain-containing protein [Lachnospiraceae bacterium]
MKKKYRFLFLIPVILLCTLFGCRKEKAELLFEDTEKIIEEDPAGSSGNSEENREAGRSEDSGGDARKESNIGKTGTAVEDTGSINAGINAAGTHEENEATVSCMVHVCGAVERPGVYELPQGSRIYQAIECAGGLSNEADPNYLNQADFVSDGEKVYVPTREEVAEMDSPLQNVVTQSGETGAPSGLVNLNTASEEQLCTLPGIGSSKARSIIAYREEHGSFDRIESVMNVAGIKDGLFQKIKAYITV